MPSYEASVVTKASAQAAWTAWTDVEGWSAYDHIERARVDGAFHPGAVITSKARGLPQQQIDHHPVGAAEPVGRRVALALGQDDLRARDRARRGRDAADRAG